MLTALAPTVSKATERTWPYSMRYRLTQPVSLLNTVILPVAINWVFNRFAPSEQLL